MTPLITAPPTEFHVRDEVRLLRQHGDIRSGARGHIVGRFGRLTDPTYLISFDGHTVCVADVRADELVLADVGVSA
jgi:hypothetical protein